MVYIKYNKALMQIFDEDDTINPISLEEIQLQRVMLVKVDEELGVGDDIILKDNDLT